MKIEVEELTRDEWAEFAARAHLECFGKHYPPERQRFDFALTACLGDQILGYVTCRETDSETVYWQFGGAFPGTRDTLLSWPGYVALVKHCNRYKRITTLIENTNRVMLKMAAKVGFVIVGVRHVGGSTLLEHYLEFDHG